VGETIMPALSVKARTSEASGRLRRSLMVNASTTSTVSMLLSSDTMLDTVLSWARSRLNRTASALKGVPSWNLTFFLRRRMSVFGSGVSQDSASPGRGWSLSSKRTRVSKTG